MEEIRLVAILWVLPFAPLTVLGLKLRLLVAKYHQNGRMNLCIRKGPPNGALPQTLRLS